MALKTETAAEYSTLIFIYPSHLSLSCVSQKLRMQYSLFSHFEHLKYISASCLKFKTKLKHKTHFSFLSTLHRIVHICSFNTIVPFHPISTGFGDDNTLYNF